MLYFVTSVSIEHITSKLISTILTTLENVQSSILRRIFSLIHVRLKLDYRKVGTHVYFSQQLSKCWPNNVLFRFISTTAMEGYMLKQMLSCIHNYG